MPRSNSYAFEVTLGWTTEHMGAADWATLHSHSKPVRSPISRDQRSRRFGGTSNSADLDTVPQNLRGRELASDSYTRLKCATLSAAPIWLTYVNVVSQSMPCRRHGSFPKTRSSISAVTGFTISLRRM